MGDGARILIAEHAARWAKNIVQEALTNYGRHLTEERASLLRTAVTALSRFDSVPLEDEHPAVVEARKEGGRHG